MKTKATDYRRYPNEWDYEESELTVSIELNMEGKFYCNWSDKFNLFCISIEGDTPKDVKSRFLDSLPPSIDRDWIKFCFCDEFEEENHAEIEKAIEIAVKTHGGHKTLDGYPYTNHLSYVMCSCMTYADEYGTVAMLKDSHLSAEYLRKEGFSVSVIQAVDAITQREDEAYEDYIKRLSNNSAAKQVKMTEVEDNLDTCLHLPQTDEIMEKIKQYRWTLDYFNPQTKKVV